MEFEIDKFIIEEFKEFVQSNEFLNCIKMNTTDLRVAMIILQTLLDKADELQSQFEERNIEEKLRGQRIEIHAYDDARLIKNELKNLFCAKNITGLTYREGETDVCFDCV